MGMHKYQGGTLSIPYKIFEERLTSFRDSWP